MARANFGCKKNLLSNVEPNIFNMTLSADLISRGNPYEAGGQKGMSSNLADQWRPRI